MRGDNYYLVTSLPALGELGSAPPMRGAELLERLDAAPARELVEMVFLADDLLQLQSVQAGQGEAPSPTVLSVQQARGQVPLPAALAPREDQPPAQSARLAADALWEQYFCHALRVAQRRGSQFLEAYLRHELGLRNALAAARAQALGLDVAAYLVAPDLAADGDFGELVSAWSSAPDPLAGLKVLDAARWSWLRQNDRWFTFFDDEIAAYAAKLMLLIRWQRLSIAT